MKNLIGVYLDVDGKGEKYNKVGSGCDELKVKGDLPLMEKGCTVTGVFHVTDDDVVNDVMIKAVKEGRLDKKDVVICIDADGCAKLYRNCKVFVEQLTVKPVCKLYYDFRIECEGAGENCNISCLIEEDYNVVVKG